MLTSDRAVEQAGILKDFRNGERTQLDAIRRYWKGRQGLPAVIPSGVPREVKVMAQIARVNICKTVIDTLAQSTFVDGFRPEGESENAGVWAAWQRNRMDKRQVGIHRAAFAYNASYAVVVPGDPLPVIRGVSPRSMTVLYGEDPDWPMWGLEKTGPGSWRLYDEEAVYYLSAERDGRFTFNEARLHGLGVTPIVRYQFEDDLDADDEVEPADRAAGARGNELAIMQGQVAPMMPIQDQIDLTTFNLLVAQHYNGFKQRYIIGWTADSEEELMKVGAGQLVTIDENSQDVTAGEWGQTDLKGYIESRDASLRHGAALSQTPVHELTGSLINMAAEALAAAEAGKDRKVDEGQTSLGESHEQMFWLSGRAMGEDVSESSQVVWRETSARSFAATVDGLGKLVQMLGIPPQELWERVPGATQQDVERWKAAAENGDSFAFLNDVLERQVADPGTPALV